MNLGKQGDEEQLGEGKEYDQNMLYKKTRFKYKQDVSPLTFDLKLFGDPIGISNHTPPADHSFSILGPSYFPTSSPLLCPWPFAVGYGGLPQVLECPPQPVLARPLGFSVALSSHLPMPFWLLSLLLLLHPQKGLPYCHVK